MFDETTGRIRTSWKTVAGLCGAVLLAMFIGRLVSAEPVQSATTPASAPARASRAAAPTPDQMERLKAAARKSAGNAVVQSPASRPAMVEVRQPGQPPSNTPPTVMAAPTPTTRPAASPAQPVAQVPPPAGDDAAPPPQTVTRAGNDGPPAVVTPGHEAPAPAPRLRRPRPLRL